MILTIIYPVDLLGPKVGGAGSFLKGIIKNVPSDIEVEFIGITSDPCRTLKCWLDIKIGNKEIKFFPVLFEKDENKRSGIPLSLRFTYALLGCALNYSGKVLFFNRIEPAIFFRNVNSPKILIIHNDIEKQIKHKGSEVFWSRMPWFYFILERYIFGFMTQIYTVSQNSLMFYWKEYVHLKDKISFLPTWVDDSIFSPTEFPKFRIRKELGLHEDIQQGKLILFVGRLQEQKAPLRLIDSFKSYSQDDPHSRLIMIGEGNLLSAVEKSINRLNLGQQVTLLKSIKQEELVKYYQAADILLLTSNYEGMPMSVLEALGCGLPIVTTNAGEVKRIVKNGFSGEVVEGFEPQDIANAIKKVLNAPSVYTSQNCIKSVEDYTPQKVLASVYDLMRKNL